LISVYHKMKPKLSSFKYLRTCFYDFRKSKNCGNGNQEIFYRDL
jgi:hypothetical protein